MVAITIILLFGVVLVIFATEFRDMLAKIFESLSVRNFFWLILLTTVITYANAFVTRGFLWILYLFIWSVEQLIILTKVPGILAKLCYAVMLIAVPVVPWLIFEGIYRLIRHTHCKITMPAMWGSWILLLTTWLRY